MIQLFLRVENKLGLHARAAARLVRLTSRFTSDIFLARQSADQEIDAKSILGVLMLAASEGTQLVISIRGPDEAEAGEAIRHFFESKFGEMQ